ncbi:MAG TPA: gliding motility-associated C-terminal domain-containing protein [Bacteroidia bacterium]|nr:gliding motility-associated C-terminal domain-containing protein [Bacteroidia bacterium]
MSFLSRIRFALLLLSFFSRPALAQLTVPDYTACPNQALAVTATWNNVSNITYTLNPGNIIQSNNPVFNITTPTVTTIYTLCAIGSSLSVPVNSCDQFTIFVNAPPPLALSNQGDYCHGDNAIITAPVGGVNYTLSGPPGVANIVSSSNVITIPNVTQVPHNGSYTVTTVINGCLSSGVTAIAVAPNYQIAVSSPSNVCQGANVNLTSSLTTATSYAWTGPNGYTSSSANNVIVCNSTNQSGLYTVYADIIFNTVTCPRQATTSINVVGTSPVVASASPSKTICEGTNLNLTAGVTSGAPQGYTWQGPQGFNSSLQNPLLTSVIPNMSGTYSVQALFFNSMITCYTDAVVTVSIVGVNQPVVAATSNACPGTSVSLGASAQGATSYSWSGPNGFSSSSPSITLIGPPVQPSISGTYFVYAYFTGGTSILCTTTKSVQINVVTVNSITVIPPGQVCQPNNANLQASAIGASSYVWYGPNNYGPVPLANAIVYYPTPAASGIYTVTAYFVNGVTCSNSNTVMLTVNPLLNFTLSPYQIICYGDPLNISGPAGGTTYSWTSSNGYSTSTQNIAIPVAQPNLSGTYTLNVSLGPCVTTGTTLVDILTPIQFTLVPQTRTICRGDTILLESGVMGGSGNNTYYWNPSIYLGSSTGSVQTGVPYGSTVYNLNVHDDFCPGYTVNTTFTVFVNEPPQPNMHLRLEEGCAPLCQIYNANTTDAFTTTYDFGGVLKFQGDSITKCLEAGTYTLKVISTGTNGCSGTYTYPAPILVYPRAGTEMKWEPESPTVTDQITLFTSNVVDPVKFTWMISNSSVSGYDTSNLPTPHVNYDVAGTYPIIVQTITDKGCIDTVTRYLQIRDDYNIFIPNTFTPNNDGLNDVFMVKGSGFKADGFVMEITDAWGTNVFSTNDYTKGWDGTIGGQVAKDGVFIYKVKVVGAHGEGRKEYIGYVTVLK